MKKEKKQEILFCFDLLMPPSKEVHYTNQILWLCRKFRLVVETVVTTDPLYHAGKSVSNKLKNKALIVFAPRPVVT